MSAERNRVFLGTAMTEARAEWCPRRTETGRLDSIKLVDDSSDF